MKGAGAIGLMRLLRWIWRAANANRLEREAREAREQAAARDWRRLPASSLEQQ
jgi:hypothetical protein